MRTKTTEEFCTEIENKYPGRWDLNRVKYIHSHSKVIVTCMAGNHERKMTPSSLQQGTNCAFCSGKAPHDTISFCKMIEKKFPDRWDLNRVKYLNNRTKIIVTCMAGNHTRKMRPGNLQQGDGCLICSGNVPYDTVFFRNMIEKKFPHRWNLNRVKYINAHFKVTVTCMAGNHTRKMTPNHLLQGYNCAFCSGKAPHDTTSFCKMIEKKYPHRWDLNRVKYLNNRTKIIVTCMAGNHTRKMTPGSVQQGQNCALCNVSKGEETIRLFLEKSLVSYESQKRFPELGRLSYDFYIPYWNLLLEFDGEQHFKISYFTPDESTLKANQKRDRVKTRYALKNGYNFLRLHYSSLEEIPMILSIYSTESYPQFALFPPEKYDYITDRIPYVDL